MNTEKMTVELTFIDDILGTAPNNPEIHAEFIASKAPDYPSMEEEIAAIGVDAEVEKGMTVFPRDEEGYPILWSYQIKGFFKSACAACQKMEGSLSEKITAYKKYVDTQVFVYPCAEDPSGRAIRIYTDDVIGDCQRPLRAMTAQGERVALANSERISKGAKCKFDIVLISGGAKAKVKGEAQKDLVREWLDYGQFNGIGQWRNSGRGALMWQEFDKEGNVIHGNLR